MGNRQLTCRAMWRKVEWSFCDTHDTWDLTIGSKVTWSSAMTNEGYEHLDLHIVYWTAFISLSVFSISTRQVFLTKHKSILHIKLRVDDSVPVHSKSWSFDLDRRNTT
jgi:hypothetical protein